MNRKLSGSALKWIALITMLIDHIGAVMIPQLYANGIGNMYFNWEIIYQICRTIGRCSFPIFCFLLVEGYQHTSSKGEYLLRMLIFALISEVFFDYAVYGSVWYLGKQNIYFELTLGILLMMGTDLIEKKLKNQMLKSALIVFLWFEGMLIAKLLELDYGVYGILSIGVLYLLRKIKILQLLGGAISFMWEFPAPLGLIPAYFYNGQRGKQNKYFFYIFYPAHLALIKVLTFIFSSSIFK